MSNARLAFHFFFVIIRLLKLTLEETLQELTVHSAGPVAIEKLALHDQVANQIRDMIIEGYLKPGSRIDEVALANELGVSRTPFREALRTLAAEGLVVSQRSKGCVVREFTAKDVRDMLEFLAHIEKLAGRMVCKKASDAEIDDLLAIHEQMLEFWNKRDRLPYYKLNQQFHSKLSLYAGNGALSETQANLQARLKRIRFMGNQHADYWDDAVSEHQDMIDALKKRDGDRLGSILEEHILNSWMRVKHLF